MSDSFISNVELVPPDAIFGLQAAYVADTHPDKVSLIIGAYRTEEGLPYVLPVVKNVEIAIANDETLNHEYLPIDGLQDMIRGAVKLALGPDSKSVAQNRNASVQSLSGTGALSLAFQFLKRFYKKSETVYICKPTWGNHKGIISHVGYTDVREYQYLDSRTQSLNINGMIEDLRQAPEYSIVLLHACAHNPCGIDPSAEEWQTICEVVKSRKLFTVFDLAYQGFISGDVDKDAWAIRYFDEQNMEMLICQSFAKIFGLYNERCGCLSVICKDSQIAMNVLSQLKIIVRRNYSNPPNHGARVVGTILNNPALFSAWKDQLKGMADRILECRTLLHSKLGELEVPGNWSHILEQKGMFTFTGLKPKQVAVLQEKYHIYMLSNGRINMCAINKKNIDYIANAFKDVVVNYNESSQL